LALVVDILCGVLSGGLFGSAVGHSDRPAGVGHFFAALRVDAFRDPLSFAADMQALLDELRNAPKEVGQERIYIHGEKEFEMAERYQVEGVPLLESTVQALCQAAESVGLRFDLPPLAD
jgi:LDH2 family malate/lactate/ureidoglycolate dehydrogenase